MAISDTRIGLKNIVSSTKSSFISATDKSKDSTSNKNTALSASVKSKLNKKAINNGMAGYLDKITNGASTKANNLGIFDNSMSTECKNNILNSDNSADNRKFTSYNDSLVIDCSPSADTVIGKIFNAKHNMLSNIAKLTDASLGNIENIVSKEVKNLVKNVGFIKDVVDELDAAKNVVNDLTSSGTSLKLKAELRALAAMCSSRSGSYVAGDSKSILSYILALALSISDCLDPKHLLSLATSLVSSGIATPEEVISAYSKNFNTSEDPKVHEKMSVLSVMLDDTENSRQPKNSVQIKGNVDNILKSLGSSKAKSTGPATDYHVTVNTLDKLDPNWDKDKDGSYNFKKVKNNDYMKGLAESNLKSSTPSSGPSLYTNIDPVKMRSIGIMASNHK